MYVIKSQTQYLIYNDSGLKLTDNILEATKWNRQKADNVLRALRSNTEFKNKQLVVKRIDENNNENKNISALIKNIHLDYNLEDKLNEIKSFANDLELRKVYLQNELSLADKEIIDIEHCAEFYKLNASQGYKIYKMLHDTRNKRREIKDELEKIKHILETQINTKNIGKLNNIFNNMDNRKYNPRIMKELFNV